MSGAGASLSTLASKEAEPVDFDALSEKIAADSLCHLWSYAQPPEMMFDSLASPIAKAKNNTPPPTPKAKRVKPNLHVDVEAANGSQTSDRSGSVSRLSELRSQSSSSKSAQIRDDVTFKDMYDSAVREDWEVYRELCLEAILKLRRVARSKMSTIVPNKTHVLAALGKYLIVCLNLC